MFVIKKLFPGMPYNPSIMFVGVASSLPSSEAPEKCFTLVGSGFTQNVRLRRKGLPGTNALAYYEYS